MTELLVCLGVATVSITVAILISKFKRSKYEVMSFKESMDLAEFPVVTFYVGDIKLNFLLDTGSNQSHINADLIDQIPHEKTNFISSISGIEAKEHLTPYCNIEVTYKDKTYKELFAVTPLTDAFNIIKKESGVQIHGILGNQFFQKYKYTLNFETLKVYMK